MLWGGFPFMERLEYFSAYLCQAACVHQAALEAAAKKLTDLSRRSGIKARDQ